MKIEILVAALCQWPSTPFSLDSKLQQEFKKIQLRGWRADRLAQVASTASFRVDLFTLAKRQSQTAQTE